MQPFSVQSTIDDTTVFLVDARGNVIAKGTVTLQGGIAGGVTVGPGVTTFNDEVTILSKNPGGALNILQQASVTTNPGVISLQAFSATDGAIGIYVAGDTSTRLTVRGDGRLAWGPGNASADVVLQRSAAGILQLTTGSFDVSTAGQGLRVAEGSNAKQGTATLAAGTVTVGNTSVTATSRIMLTIQNPNGGTPGAVYVSARTAGTSFTITSTSGADTSIVAYEIFEVG